MIISLSVTWHPKHSLTHPSLFCVAFRKTSDHCSNSGEHSTETPRDLSERIPSNASGVCRFRERAFREGLGENTHSRRADASPRLMFKTKPAKSSCRVTIAPLVLFDIFFYDILKVGGQLRPVFVSTQLPFIYKWITCSKSFSVNSVKLWIHQEETSVFLSIHWL